MKNISSIIVIAIVGLCALLLYKMYSSATGIFSPDTSNQLRVSGTRQKSDEQLKIIADQIENEITNSVINTDEGLIINLIQSLTPGDLTALYNIFGKRFNNFKHAFTKVDLVEFLRDQLSSNEFNSINQNLVNAGII